MDFVSVSLSGGRRLKYLTVADDFSYESIDLVVDIGISGQHVTQALDHAALFHGYPQAVRTDYSPEFTSRAFMAWSQSHGIRHILIQPGRSMQNGYIECFNGKFRDEHLSEFWFETLHQARLAMAVWQSGSLAVWQSGSQTTTRSGHTAAWDACHRLVSPDCIASAPAMQLNSHQLRDPSSNL